MSGHRNSKSLRSRVTALVRQLGEATTDDLLPHLPEWERWQVMNALQNEKYHGHLVIVRREGKPGQGGGAPAVYAVSPVAPTADKKPAGRVQIPKRITAHMGRVASVWALGAGSAR